MSEKPKTLPISAEAWADHICERFGCIHDTADLPRTIQIIQQQAIQDSMRMAMNFASHFPNVKGSE